MRLSLFAISLLSSVLCQAQETSPIKPDWGFRFGINRSSIQEIGGAPNGIEVANKNGIEFEALMRLEFRQNWFFSQTAGLSFNRGILRYELPNGIQNAYQVLPKSMDLSSFISWVPEAKKVVLSVGPKFQIPLWNRQEDSTSFGSAPNVGVNFALGYSINLGASTLLPEVRYTRGLMNVNRLPLVQSVELSTLSLGVIWVLSQKVGSNKIIH